MMKGDEGMKKIVKSYSEDGVKYQFNDKKMQMYANQLKSDLQVHGKKKINKSDIQKELADKLFVSEDAVKNWMYGYNAPSDLEQVKLIADYFGVDYHQLLDTEEKEMATNNVVSIATGMANETQIQYTKERVREVYAAVMNVINKIMEYFYIEEQPEGLDRDQYKEQSVAAHVDAFMAAENVFEILEKYLLDIPEKLYNEVCEYIWTTLSAILDDIEDTYNTRMEKKDDDEFYNMTNRELDKRVEPFRKGGYISDMRRIFADFIVK